MTEILQQGTRFPGPPIGPQVVDSPPGQHLVQFYDDDQILAAAVAEFLAKGLEAREALLVVATPGHVEMIEDTLSHRGLDLAGARANGQLTVLDAADALDQFFDGEEPDWDRFLAEIGGAAARSIVASPSGRVRAYGEMVDLLCRRGLYRAALQLEEFWNRLQGQYPLSLLCAYVMGSFFSESQSADFRLVDDLLDVSRVARGLLELRRQRVDLRDVLAKAIDMASPLLEARRHHFEVHAPARGLVVLEADEARLAQVVANLLTNAAKYTPVGGHVSVRARRAGAQLVLEVADDGIGIAPELMPNIFDLFVQGRQSIDRGEGGLGIGLALVRSLVQLHGGTVAAQSGGPGKGSTFTVRLPATQVNDARSRADSGSPVTVARARRILLVDDNEDAAAMLAEILATAGHEVRTAGDGPTALQSASTFRPDLAVLDIGLPAMDGYELAARLRAQAGAAAPILIALSGYGQESDRARSEAAGFAVHLVKPIDAMELLSTIEDRFHSRAPKK